MRSVCELAAFCCVLGLATSGAAAGQTIYRHVDEQGRVTFSNAPSEADAQPHVLEGATAHGTGAPPPPGSMSNSIQYEYDAVGNVTKIIRPDSVTKYEYSPDRELIGQEVLPR